MGGLIRAIDWERTSLGPVESWSSVLRMTVPLILANRFPQILWWGPKFIQFYNDAYRPIPGTKHPKSMGQPAHECWAEIWDVIGPLIETPFRGGAPTWMEDILLEINRHGFIEETHFTIAYSPVADDAVPDGIGGVLATVHEITAKVVGERRVGVLRDLGARAGEAKTAEEACALVAETLARHPRDIPFAFLYLIDQGGRRACLAGAAGNGNEALSPPIVPLDGQGNDPDVWPLARAARTETMQVVNDLGAVFAEVPQGPWSDSPHTAVVVPVLSNKARHPAGFLVAGISARLALDDPYKGFLELMATQIATAIGNARAYEEERRRAEALAEIDRAKTLFFSNVSHEFRTPLTLMLGPLEDVLARSEILPDDTRERIAIAHRNGLRLLKLVNSLLDFSRIEAGRIQASYEPVDIASFTAELASNFRSATDQAGLTLVIEADPLTEPVYLDRDMWEKVVLNLVSNAFKFTFAGEIRVKVHPSADGKSVDVVVSDTGTGIPAGDLPRVFERFHRIEGAQGRSYEGSGIGLALVQELVKLHGGVIRVASEPGRGSVFTVTLPLGIGHLPADRIGGTHHLTSTATRAGAFVEEALSWLPEVDGRGTDAAILGGDARDTVAPPVPTRMAGSGGRVLLADDNADMRGYLKRLLVTHGFAVEAVANGSAALAAAREQPMDIVLADVMMPGLDGFGLLRALRADPHLNDIPVVLLSARAGEEARVEGLDAGADDYLIKPFSQRELVARVSANLKLAQTRREAAETLRTLNQELNQRVDELHHLQEAQKVMVAELQHRTRNLIAIVQAIATHTMRDAASPDEFQRQFHDRLRALSRVQGLLSHSGKGKVTIGNLIRMELDALGAGEMPDRIMLSGPDVALPNAAVQTLALAVHELATNARKYGALAIEHGCLTITWAVRNDPDGQRLTLDWIEDRPVQVQENRPQQGGDRARQGYGRELIERALPYVLGAKTRYELVDTGVRCMIDLPITGRGQRGTGE